MSGPQAVTSTVPDAAYLRARDAALAEAAILPRGRWFITPGGVVLYVARRPPARGYRLIISRASIGYRGHISFSFRRDGYVAWEAGGAETRATRDHLLLLAVDLADAERWPARRRKGWLDAWPGAGTLTYGKEPA